MTTIAQQLAAEHAAHDPYGFKTQGAASVKTLHVNEPYEHQEFPKVLYKTTDTETLSTTVGDQDQYDKAKSDGFSETQADAPPVAATGVISVGAVYAQLIFTNEAGDVIGEGEKQKITPVAFSAPIREVPAGSGTERWPDGSGSARYGDPYGLSEYTDQSAHHIPTQEEADAAAAPDEVIPEADNTTHLE
jgi:hypothetical protein